MLLYIVIHVKYLTGLGPAATGAARHSSRHSALRAAPLISTILVSAASLFAQQSSPTPVLDAAISALCRAEGPLARFAQPHAKRLAALKENNKGNAFFLAAINDILPMLSETSLAPVCHYFAEVDDGSTAIRFGELNAGGGAALKTIVISPLNSHGAAITITYNSDPSDSSVKKSSVNFILNGSMTQKQHDDLAGSLRTFFFDSTTVQLNTLASLIGQKK
jgi:hypothetical protein